jgi:hypothetical protein
MKKYLLFSALPLIMMGGCKPGTEKTETTGAGVMWQPAHQATLTRKD